MAKLIVTFRNFANAPKNWFIVSTYCYFLCGRSWNIYNVLYG